MAWHIRASNKMLTLGVIFITAGFFLMPDFLILIPFSPSDKLTIWIRAVLIISIFELGLFSIVIVKMKEAIAALLALFFWSLIFLIPIPEGSEDYVWGGSMLLLMAALVAYAKRKESRNKKMQLETKMETE